MLGGAVAWSAFKAGREIVGRPALREVFAHKFYFDELYDAVFSRPAQLIANRLRDDVEGPVVQGSLGEIGTGVETRQAGRRACRAGSCARTRS